MARSASRSDDRGRHADRPGEIPKRGWRDVLLRAKDGFSRDHVSIVSAGVAFYVFLAIFPGIAAMISIWALAFDPQQIQNQIASLSAVLPEEAANIISNQARAVARSAGTGVSLTAIGGVLLALYSTSKGVKALIEGLNIVQNEEEARGFIKLNLTALLLTIFLTVGMVVTLGLVAVLPVLLETLGLGPVVEALARYLRWPILVVVAILGLAVMYRYAPSRHQPQWRWISWGAVVATVLWIAVSILFSVYVRNFGNYNATYGALGAIVVLLMWLWISALIVLLGAELNAEMEHQTETDTTTGPSRPMGRRRAHVADTVGEER